MNGTEEKLKKMRELTALLNEASKAYYSQNKELMSNFEYDALYDELCSLENETGITLSNSPTAHVGYEASNELLKERHESPMLSLDKTKDPAVLADFIKGQKSLLSWKLDGLTVVLTYEDGKLLKAVTRGNGEIGEVITANAKTFVNIPLSIPFKGRLILRGEAVIKYSDFEKVNEGIDEDAVKYKNPRNLCSGSVRVLDPAVTAKRHVHFFVFSLESAEGMDFNNSYENAFSWVSQVGFDVVPFKIVTSETLLKAVGEYEEKIKSYDVPSDGLVVLMDNIEYGKSLGRTAKFPRNSMAFKWKDETAQTILRNVEWSPSRTGLINPVAVFDPVELEGTTVTRASLHNVSVAQSLKLGIGDTLVVYKANMIIPQIAENLTGSNNLPIPVTCPACLSKTRINDVQGIKTLVCDNPECSAKRIKSFANFVSRNCMNIDGISEETLEKLIGRGFIRDFSDIYHLQAHKDDIVNMPGFGEISYENIIASVNASRKTTCARLLAALGISNVGRATALVISAYFKNDFSKIMDAPFEELKSIEGVGDIIAGFIAEYFKNPVNYELVKKLLCELDFEEEQTEEDSPVKGLTFVITGSLEGFENRDELKEIIEKKGGRVAGSVSSKTSYLINNDIHSGSGKNKKARELNIPIISEKDFVAKFL